MTRPKNGHSCRLSFLSHFYLSRSFKAILPQSAKGPLGNIPK